MKILQKGVLPSKQIYRATCRHCGTQIEFHFEEAEFISDQRDGDFLSIPCPLPMCLHKITVAYHRPKERNNPVY